MFKMGHMRMFIMRRVVIYTYPVAMGVDMCPASTHGRRIPSLYCDWNCFTASNVGSSKTPFTSSGGLRTKKVLRNIWSFITSDGGLFFFFFPRKALRYGSHCSVEAPRTCP